MKVLVVGGGGREHAIIWKLSQSPKKLKIYCAPGNAGIEKYAQNLSIQATDVKGIMEFSKKERMDLVVVTPDDPLALGMVDALEKEGIRAFGPRKDAAIIEWSKAFSKKFMKQHNIPTAEYRVFDKMEDALDYAASCEFPLVIKADGLALGKGVFIAKDMEEAIKALRSIMLEQKFGNAGSKVLIEEFLEGDEVSVLAFTDGSTLIPMISSKDHKKAYDGEVGPNTGGMGAIAPNPHYSQEVSQYCMEHIFMPTVKGMKEEGRMFKGVLYFGLMLTPKGPKVLEYNARFGDPETQAILPLLQTDLFEIFEAVVEEKLSQISISWMEKTSACVVMASGGYPEDYQTGYAIQGLQDQEELMFHSGTKALDGEVVTNGGRVLGITALGETIEEAKEKVYQKISGIYFEKIHYRKDIGAIR
jgi:phosphoribosylamine---glycine ligase